MGKYKILSLALLCAMLTSCGLKGGLYRESEKGSEMNMIEGDASRNINTISG